MSGPHPSLAYTSGQSGSVASATTNVCRSPASTFVSWPAAFGICATRCSVGCASAQRAGAWWINMGEAGTRAALASAAGRGPAGRRAPRLAIQRRCAPLALLLGSLHRHPARRKHVHGAACTGATAARQAAHVFLCLPNTPGTAQAWARLLPRCLQFWMKCHRPLGRLHPG